MVTLYDIDALQKRVKELEAEKDAFRLAIETREFPYKDYVKLSNAFLAIQSAETEAKP